MMHFREFIPNPQTSAIWASVVLIGTLGTVYRAMTPVAPIGPIALAAFAVLILLGNEVWRRLNLGWSRGLPDKESALNPFHIKSAWPRDNEAEKLAEIVIAEEGSHILVVGPSGAGKTQLVKFLLEPELKKQQNPDGITDELRFICTDRYDTPVVRAIKDLGASNSIKRDQLINAIITFVKDKNKRCSVRELFDPTCAEFPNFREAHEIWRNISRFLDLVLSQDRITVFAFDQLERVSQSIRIDSDSPKSGDNGFEIFFFLELIKYLQARRNVRTLFVVRAEYLYHAYDFLKNETRRLGGPGEVSVIHYLCPGINTETDKYAVEKIENDVSKISEDAFFLTSFVKITGLHSRTVSNTFMTRLCGYIVDCYYAKDERVRDMVYKEVDRKEFARFYFDCLFNEYAKTNREIDAVDVLKAVVFSIAVENRLAGRAASPDRISCLTHLPLDDVGKVIDFLKIQGLVVQDSVEDLRLVDDGIVERRTVEAYRLVHDIVSDFAIEDEKFSFDIRLKDGIRGLSEARVFQLKPVSEFAGPFRDLSRVIEDLIKNGSLKKLNMGLCFILLFYVFGAAKVIFDPEVCNKIVYPILRDVWFARECSFVSQFYVLIFITHIVWVTFIYYLDRNFFQYTLDSRAARWLSSKVAVVGVMLGIGFSQSPALFLVPVIFGGLAMGALIVRGTWNGSYRGRSAKEFRAWGWRTMLNMIFVAWLTAVSAMVLMNDSAAKLFFGSWAIKIGAFFGGHFDITAETLIVGWMYLVSIVMIVYWWAIRPGQQSKISIASRRALRDRTYFENQTP